LTCLRDFREEKPECTSLLVRSWFLVFSFKTAEAPQSGIHRTSFCTPQTPFQQTFQLPEASFAQNSFANPKSLFYILAPLNWL